MGIADFGLRIGLQLTAYSLRLMAYGFLQLFAHGAAVNLLEDTALYLVHIILVFQNHAQCIADDAFAEGCLVERDEGGGPIYGFGHAGHFV